MKKALLLLAAMVLCFSTVTWAQDTANITGTVTDSTGAVIPNAKITVSNPAVAYTRETVSDTAGIYTVSRVPIGNYTVTCEASGFQKLVRSGITLTVGQIQRVDLQLTVGQVTQEVTVTGNVPQVETETAAISDVVTGSQIANLELNGRNFVTLALLVPGASPDEGLDTSHVGVYGNNSISFNGSRTQYNNWEIDGGNNTDEGSAGTFNTYPNLDTIAEFRISTSNYGADMGKHAGATIEVATKSGTREFHGDAFEYLRNDVFDAEPFFINRASIGAKPPRTPLKWNDYGYTLGGPFYIPGHYNSDKSKTFFYWSEDWRKYREGQVIGSTVPTDRMRAGDFSECDFSSANYNPIVAGTDPTSPQCVPPTINGVVTDVISPGVAGTQAATNFTDAQVLLNGMVPKSNSGFVAGGGNWTLASGTSTNWRQEQIRVDQNVSDKTTVFVRWTNDAWNTVAVPALWSWASFDTVKTPFGGPGKSGVLHITHSFKPNLMNEFVMGYTVDHILLSNQAGTSCGGPCQINRTSSFQGAPGQPFAHFFSPFNDSNTLLPAIFVCGGGPCFGEDAGNHPWFNSNPILTWKDNIAWTHSNHTLRFGFFLEDYRKNEQFGADTQGQLYFDTWGSNSSGSGLADMFLANMQEYLEGTETFNGQPVGGYPKGHWQMKDFEPYIQDDWKVNSHLTINIGLRYYYLTRIHDVSRPTVDSGFLPNLFNPANEEALTNDPNLGPVLEPLAAGSPLHNYTFFGNGLVECGHNGIPNGCQLNNDGSNWAPRFGFSWDPWGNGKTVVRGGYGIYYEMGNGNEAQAEGGEGNPPVALSPGVFNVTGYQNIKPVFVGGAYTQPVGPTGYIAWPYSQKWGSEQQFSLGMQHQFGQSNLLTVGYVGMLARHLARGRQLNQVPFNAGMMNAPALQQSGGVFGSYCSISDPSGNCVGGASASAVYDYLGNVVDPGDLGQTLCDPTTGSCDVQRTLIFNELGTNQFFVPYSNYSSIGVKENTAVASYNALQVNFRHTFGHGLTYQAAYTWAHNIDDSSSTYYQSGVDDYHLSRWKATSGLNRAQVLTMNYIYDLPFGKNASNAILRQAISGWQVSGISTFFSGEPIDMGCGITGFGTGIGQSLRCNAVGRLKIKKGVFNDPTYGPTVTWFDPNVLAQPSFGQLTASNQPGMFGTLDRNPLTGPGAANTDLALLKNFNTPWFRGEHSTLQFRWETFNTFNHTQWNGINFGCNGDPGSVTLANGDTQKLSAFGRPCGGSGNVGNGEVNSARPPRIMQLGMKLIF